MSNKRGRRDIRNKGVAMVLVSLSMILIMGMAALAVDVGNMYLEKASLEKATELAALGAAQAMKQSDDPAYIEAKALEIFTANGLDPQQAEISVQFSNGSETAYINAVLKVPFYFAKVLGFESIDLAATALAELLPDGSSRLIQESTYDLVPWGIPHGKTWYDTEDEELNIDNSYFYEWAADSGFEFQVGDEYLLKLGHGKPADPLGRRLLIVMDGDGDMPPADSADPICPELGSRVQSEYLKAYGLAYWCLQRGYVVEWLLDYNGGSFLVDYNEEILEAVSDTGVDLSGVSKIVLTSAQASQLSDWLDSHNSSEGRPYTIVSMDQTFDLAVYSPNRYSGPDLVPWGVEPINNNLSYPFGFTLGDTYVLKYGSGAWSGSPDKPYQHQGNWGALALGGNGANEYRDNIKFGESNPDHSLYYAGKQVYTEPGNMVGPTFQGVEYRIDNDKLYVTVPVVDSLDVNGRKLVTILGFLYFKLTGLENDNHGNTSHGWVYGELVEKVPADKLQFTVEDPDVTTLVEAGLPFDYIHDEDILANDLDSYEWLYCIHTDFYNNSVAAKIAQWVSDGHFLFNMCSATNLFDNALEEYNHETFADDTTQYIPRMFFKTYGEKQHYRCHHCQGQNLDCEYCFHDGWISEFVKHSEVGNIGDSSYSILPRDIMQTQNHVLTVPKDSTACLTMAFNKDSIITDYQTLAKDNADADYKEGMVAYINSSIGRMLSRSYKISETDDGGFVTFYGGHAPMSEVANLPACRLVLNNVLAGSQANALKKSRRHIFGALDLDTTIEDKDADEYLANIKYGFEKFLYPGKVVHALPDNLPAETNAGVAFNVGNNGGAWDNHVSDSPRVVLVPIVSTKNADGTNTCTLEQTNLDDPPACIYGIFQRDTVLIKGVAKFWLLDVLDTDPDELDDDLGPVENGQVRGIFLGYFIPPIE
ncbi:MAG: Tad domain-containing protein [Candidatus Wallbacteria bacterium]|nr:Tad domain-containing protein [Candidatus Wallbacteria bacterium]